MCPSNESLDVLIQDLTAIRDLSYEVCVAEESRFVKLVWAAIEARAALESSSNQKEQRCISRIQAILKSLQQSVGLMIDIDPQVGLDLLEMTKTAVTSSLGDLKPAHPKPPPRQTPGRTFEDSGYKVGDRVYVERTEHGWFDGSVNGWIVSMGGSYALVEDDEGRQYEIEHVRDIHPMYSPKRAS